MSFDVYMHNGYDDIMKNNLLILEGETGSGKSTQLPQLLC